MGGIIVNLFWNLLSNIICAFQLLWLNSAVLPSPNPVPLGSTSVAILESSSTISYCIVVLEQLMTWRIWKALKKAKSTVYSLEIFPLSKWCLVHSFVSFSKDCCYLTTIVSDSPKPIVWWMNCWQSQRNYQQLHRNRRLTNAALLGIVDSSAALLQGGKTM